MEQVILKARTQDVLAGHVYWAIQSVGYRRQLANIECESDGTTVWLRGLVNSFYLKQVAQTVATKVSGVSRVINELQVADLAPHGSR